MLGTLVLPVVPAGHLRQLQILQLLQLGSQMVAIQSRTTVAHVRLFPIPVHHLHVQLVSTHYPVRVLYGVHGVYLSILLKQRQTLDLNHPLNFGMIICFDSSLLDLVLPLELVVGPGQLLGNGVEVVPPDGPQQLSLDLFLWLLHSFHDCRHLQDPVAGRSLFGFDLQQLPDESAEFARVVGRDAAVDAPGDLLVE